MTPWMTPRIPLKSSFGRRWHGSLPSLPGLRSTGSCPCRSCRPAWLQAGSARWCLSSRWRSSPGPSLPSPGAVPNLPTTAIVESGPYRFTRNPIYLGPFLGLIGLAIAFDNLWLLIMLVPFALVICYGVVAREEAYLERKFGDVTVATARVYGAGCSARHAQIAELKPATRRLSHR